MPHLRQAGTTEERYPMLTIYVAGFLAWLALLMGLYYAARPQGISTSPREPRHGEDHESYSAEVKEWSKLHRHASFPLWLPALFLGAALALSIPTIYDWIGGLPAQDHSPEPGRVFLDK